MVLRGTILCVIGEMLEGTEDQTHIALCEADFKEASCSAWNQWMSVQADTPSYILIAGSALDQTAECRLGSWMAVTTTWTRFKFAFTLVYLPTANKCCKGYK